jgi:uncharacterized delta-60 repeat protein
VHPGDLDSTFGNGGRVTTDFAGNRDQAFALALQSDGKIVAAGSAIVSGAQPDFALARYNSDGSLDSTFGSGGKVTTDFGGNDQAVAVAIQPDGKIVAVGATCANATQGCDVLTGSGYDFAIARYNSNGTLDSSFGSGGKVTTDFHGGMDIATSLVIQADGRIVVAGSACTDSSMMCALSGGVQFALARYNSDGSLDSSFGTGGKITTTVRNFGSILAVALQTDGKLIAAGLAFGQSDSDFELVRYNSDGSLDSSFGAGGKVNTDFNSSGSGSGLNDAAVGLAIQQDGKIIAAGASETNTPDFFYNWSIARYNQNGSLDASFGIGGKVSTGLSGNDDQAGSVMIQPDGKILVGGMAGGFVTISTNSLSVIDQGSTMGSDFALVRYNTNGSQDTSFGTGGKVTTDFFGSSDAARFALEPDGRVVAAGFARHSRSAFGAARPTGVTGQALYGWLLGLADAQSDADFALARYETGVAAQPDFAIQCDPATSTTTAGTKVSMTVNISRTGGFAGNVTVAPPATVPRGLKIPGDPVPTTGSSVSFRIKVKGSAAAGSYPLVFTATDDSGRTRTATFTLVIQ